MSIWGKGGGGTSPIYEELMRETGKERCKTSFREYLCWKFSVLVLGTGREEMAAVSGEPSGELVTHWWKRREFGGLGHLSSRGRKGRGSTAGLSERAYHQKDERTIKT